MGRALRREPLEKLRAGAGPVIFKHAPGVWPLDLDLSHIVFSVKLLRGFSPTMNLCERW